MKVCMGRWKQLQRTCHVISVDSQSIILRNTVRKPTIWDKTIETIPANLTKFS